MRITEVKSTIVDIMENDDTLTMMCFDTNKEEEKHNSNSNNISAHHNINIDCISNSHRNESVELSDIDHVNIDSSNTNIYTNISTLPHSEDKQFVNIQNNKIKSIVNIEMILENYLMQIEWIEAEILDTLDEITNTEGSIPTSLYLY
jgi:hypothetical protein